MHEEHINGITPKPLVVEGGDVVKVLEPAAAGLLAEHRLVVTGPTLKGKQIIIIL